MGAILSWDEFRVLVQTGDSFRYIPEEPNFKVKLLNESAGIVCTCIKKFKTTGSEAVEFTLGKVKNPNGTSGHWAFYDQNFKDNPVFFEILQTAAEFTLGDSLEAAVGETVEKMKAAGVTQIMSIDHVEDTSALDTYLWAEAQAQEEEESLAPWEKDILATIGSASHEKAPEPELDKLIDLDSVLYNPIEKKIVSPEGIIDFETLYGMNGKAPKIVKVEHGKSHWYNDQTQSWVSEPTPDVSVPSKLNPEFTASVMLQKYLKKQGWGIDKDTRTPYKILF